LAGNLIHLRAQPSAVGYDDVFVSQTQGGQFSADDLTVRAPVDMEESQSPGDIIRLPGKPRKWNGHFGLTEEPCISSLVERRGP
jgi:hypothetical protein